MNSFCNISSKKTSIKLPNDPSCSIHEFYKGRLQSLIEIRFHSRVIQKVTAKTPICILEEESEHQTVLCTKIRRKKIWTGV